MKTRTRLSLAGVVALTLATAEFAGVVLQQKHSLTKADVDRMMTELSNWGRWGKDDQLGAVNLITAAKRKQAAALVREGFSVSLARDTNTEKAEDNSDPYEHTMTLTGVNNDRVPFSIDNFKISFHGYQHTHLDALCHMFWQGKMYNGYSQEEVTQRGAGKLAITTRKQGIFTGGILMEMARRKGRPYLEPGTRIYLEALKGGRRRPG